MNALDLAKGALIGAIVGGAVSGVRQLGKQKSSRQPLGIAHDNMKELDPELVEHFQDYYEYKKVLQKDLQQEFDNNFAHAATAAERELGIELQIEQEEIVPSYKDYHEAESCALIAMEWLRANEHLFSHSAEMLREVRDKGTQIAAQLSLHLQNISSECLPRY